MSQESSSTESANISTLTRVAIPKESIKQDVPSVLQDVILQTTTSSSTDPSPKELIELGRPPYIVDLMKAGQAYETFDIKDRLSEIDSFIREDSETREEYEEAFNRLVKKITKSSIYSDIDQLLDLVRIEKKIKEVLREKEEFEAKDPLDMNAKELERFFKDKL